MHTNIRTEAAILNAEKALTTNVEQELPKKLSIVSAVGSDKICFQILLSIKIAVISEK